MKIEFDLPKMTIDFDEPYDLIARTRDDVRAEFWKRAKNIINDIYEEFWQRDVIALGKERWLEGRMKGLDAFMTEEELIERTEGLEGLYAKVEKEHNERAAKKSLHDGR